MCLIFYLRKKNVVRVITYYFIVFVAVFFFSVVFAHLRRVIEMIPLHSFQPQYFAVSSFLSFFFFLLIFRLVNRVPYSFGLSLASININAFIYSYFVVSFIGEVIFVPYMGLLIRWNLRYLIF